MSKNNKTHNMADTPASNGQLILPTHRAKNKVKPRKVRKSDPCALSNAGVAIWNPLSGRYIGDKHYYKIKQDSNIDLAQLERNNWITSFNGKLTDEEFIAQDHVQSHLRKNSITPPATQDWTQEDEDGLDRQIEKEMELANSPYENNKDIPDPVMEKLIEQHYQSADATVKESTIKIEPVSSEYEQLMNTCINQAKMIDKLQAEVKGLQEARHKDDKLLEKYYRAGRESTAKMEKMTYELGRVLGMCQDGDLPF